MPQDRPPRLALVMIARNEARCIARCLESVRAHVDQMIVLDTGSTDDTVAIARRCGAIVHHLSWPDDFAAARNAALDHSDADWNLMLDADEWLDGDATPLGAETLPAAVPARFIGCVRLINHGEDGDLTSRAFLPRILPRGVRYEGRVHEQPVSPLPRLLLPLALHHDGYAEAQAARKAGRNTALLEAELARTPEDAYLWFQLGREQLARDQLQEAAASLATAYRTGTPDQPFRRAIVVTTIRALRRAEYLAEALALVDAEQENWTDSPDFFFAVGELYLEWASRNPQTALDELLPVAEGAWKHCLSLGERPDQDGSIHGCGSHLAAHNLAILYETLGMTDQATHYAQAAIEMRASADQR